MDLSTQTFEHRIRQTAYRLWEEAGRPNGLADEHWAKATEIELAGNTVISVPAAKTPKNKRRASKKTMS